MPNGCRPRTHDWIDERSLALHEAVVRRLLAEPESVLIPARANLARWMKSAASRTQPVLQEWAGILAGSPEKIAAVATAWNEESRRLRQSSPLVAGVLPEHERREIFEQFRQLLQQDEPLRT